MWCDCCGDLVSCAYPLTLVFHDNTSLTLNICVDCYHKDKTLRIKLQTKHLIAKVCNNIIKPFSVVILK